MRWQRIARLAIASFVIVFAGVVFFTMRQRAATPADVPLETEPSDGAKIANQGPLESELTQNGKLRYRIIGERHRVYADGRNTIEHVELTLPDRKGKTIVIKADEAEVTQPPGKQLGVAVFKNNVVLSTNDGLEVKTATATYTDANGVITVPGPVEFKRGRMSGTGVGATYDRNREVIWLLANAHVVVTPADILPNPISMFDCFSGGRRSITPAEIVIVRPLRSGSVMVAFLATLRPSGNTS